MSRFLKTCLLPLSTFMLLTACGQDAQNNTGTSGANNEFDNSRVGHYGLGSRATPEQIAGWDIDIRPDGAGLPEGSGSVEDGEYLYEDKCAHCHGTFGEGEGRHPVLAGGQGSLKDARPSKTVGSYWPYASTLYDYIYRAMPFTQPESLSPDETYALTAYVLYLNELVEDDFVLSRDNLTDVHLPNEGNFVPDPRPDTANTRCMENCRDPKAIKIMSEVAPNPASTKTMSPDKTESAPENQHPGQQTYQQFCSICHASGVAGAPKLGDKTAWTPRIAQGIDKLTANAINGISSDGGIMPPKGGFAQLSNGQVGDAVRFIMEASQ